MFLSFEHVGIRAANIQQAISFYRQVFGFSLNNSSVSKCKNVQLAVIERDDLRIQLIEDGLTTNKQYSKEGFINHIAFISSHKLENDLKVIQENGWEIFKPGIVLGPTGRRYVFFEGKQGEKLQIVELPGEKFFNDERDLDVPPFSQTTFEHIGLRVRDFNKSVEFYAEVLGFELTRALKTDDNLKQIQFIKGYGVELEIVYNINDKNPIPEGVTSHLAFKVHDILQTAEMLKEKNIFVAQDSPLSDINGYKVAYFLGPDGEKIQINQVT